jgi:recombination protein RecT
MAAPQTTGNGQIVPRSKEPKTPATELRNQLHKMLPQIAMALPKHITAERLVRVAMTAITKTPKLVECDRGTFFACLLTAAQLGLEPNTPLGQGYLIPRWNKNLYGKNQGGLECTWLTGYQGYIDLAYRSGMVTGIRANLVHEGDEFEWEEGLEPKLVHRPSTDPDRHEKPIRFAYGVVRIRDADPHFQVLSLAEIDRRRLMNEAVKKGYFSPWSNHFGEMAKKTVVRATVKYAPKSAELIRAESLERVGEGHRDSIADAVDSRIAEAIVGQGLALPAPDDASAPPSDPPPPEAEEKSPDTAPAAQEAKPNGKRKSRRRAAEPTGKVPPEDEPTDEQLAAERERGADQ